MAPAVFLLEDIGLPLAPPTVLLVAFDLLSALAGRVVLLVVVGGVVPTKLFYFCC